MLVADDAAELRKSVRMMLALERDLSNLLGLKVSVKFKSGGGELTIHYTSLDQLDDVLTACESLRRMHKRGVRVLPGGDYGFAFTPHLDNARDLDFAVRWGFGWDSGPFETWQAAGWQKITGWIEAERAAGKTMSDTPLPHWVSDTTREAVHTALGSYSPTTDSYQQRSQLTVYQRQEFPDRLTHEQAVYGKTIFEKPMGTGIRKEV